MPDPLFVAGITVLALLTISPGAATVLVTKLTLERGRRAALGGAGVRRWLERLPASC
jgi:threonine/homoserine/homoserine lactone efflux protein